ncbi:MAG: hypothetical protein DMF04_10025, partial [Verrucomicrobia bacterium]
AERARERFLEYIHSLNLLRDKPRWYNAVTTNCTTSIRTQRPPSQRTPWNWRILANGKGDELLYQMGALDQSLSFAELKRRARINQRALYTSDGSDFSNQIRVGIPGY